MLERLVSFWRKPAEAPLPPTLSTNTPTGGNDHHVWIRRPSSGNGGSSPPMTEQQTRFSAKIRNISRGTIQLDVLQRIEVGGLLIVEMPKGPDFAGDQVLACVLRIIDQSEGTWTLDCGFASELDDNELEALGAERIRTSGSDRRTRVRFPSSDRRTWVRFPSQAEATFALVNGAEGTAQPVKVLDISASGLGLLANQAVEAGSLLSLELHKPTGKATHKILASVVRVHVRSADQWVLGCHFIRPLKEPELGDLL